MNLPDHIPLAKLKGKRTYDWDRRIANGFFAAPGENHPKLWDDFFKLSVRAAYALGVACAEWVAARMQQLGGDITDSLDRIEAGWVATLDWQAIAPPRPETPKTGPNPDPVIEPVWMIGGFLQYMQQAYEPTKDGFRVRDMAARLALLARKVGCKAGGFDAWLADALTRTRKAYPAKKVALADEAQVSPSLFRADWSWRAVNSANPYLTDVGRTALAAAVTAAGDNTAPAGVESSRATDTPASPAASRKKTRTKTTRTTAR